MQGVLSKHLGSHNQFAACKETLLYCSEMIYRSLERAQIVIHHFLHQSTLPPANFRIRSALSQLILFQIFFSINIKYSN